MTSNKGSLVFHIYGSVFETDVFFCEALAYVSVISLPSIHCYFLSGSFRLLYLNPNTENTSQGRLQSRS